MSRFFKFKPGDVCITQNSSVGLLNNGLAVRVVRIDPLKVDHLGGSCPYLIARLDGDVFPSTAAPTDGAPRWYKTATAFCAEHRLRRLDPSDPVADVHLTEEFDDVEAATTV